MSFFANHRAEPANDPINEAIVRDDMQSGDLRYMQEPRIEVNINDAIIVDPDGPPRKKNKAKRALIFLVPVIALAVTAAFVPPEQARELLGLGPMPVEVPPVQTAVEVPPPVAITPVADAATAVPPDGLPIDPSLLPPGLAVAGVPPSDAALPGLPPVPSLPPIPGLPPVEMAPTAPPVAVPAPAAPILATVGAGQGSAAPIAAATQPPAQPTIVAPALQVSAQIENPPVEAPPRKPAAQSKPKVENVAVAPKLVTPPKVSSPEPRRAPAAAAPSIAKNEIGLSESVKRLVTTSASDFGIRSIQPEGLIFTGNNGGRPVIVLLGDVMPNGERLQSINIQTNTVITDKSVIRVN
ncbi:hypothetical protein [Azonexus hydrophilus]|uniref:Uncharacterized protein n=1 Tax=Azonexus hydrophilus TaxID=418702 RepID=A0ABZ2XNR3_9RHOO